jgi:hypothetical protein
MKNRRAISGVVLVFILGILCGILATHLVYTYRIESIISGRGQDREEIIVSRLIRKLGLDSRQEVQVREIVHATHEDIREMRSRLRPRTEAIIEKAQTSIRAILSPEQQAKYEQMITARKAKMRGKGL